MQKMVFVKEDWVSEINNYIKYDWKVVSVTPAIKCTASKYDSAIYGVYVVIEKVGDNA